MAVTISKNENIDLGVHLIVVAFTAENDALVFKAPRATGMSIQSVGTHGTATINIQGSNDGVTYVALPTAVSLTTAGIKSAAVADLSYLFYRVIELAAAATLTAHVVWTEAGR